MRRFAQLAQAVLGSEMELHRSYAADWGISAAELEAEQPTATTRAYTDFLVRTAALADYGELAAALLPCMWGYQELAARLAERGRSSEELYARWIDEYAGAEFGELTTWCKALTNAAARTGDRDRMTDAFLTSSRYELAFWDASWREEAPFLP
jgi:thiaminase (transcriptional activator TenA)